MAAAAPVGVRTIEAPQVTPVRGFFIKQVPRKNAPRTALSCDQFVSLFMQPPKN